MMDVRSLSATAVAPLKGKVQRLEVEAVVAAAMTVAWNAALDQAHRVFGPDRVLEALSIRRHLGKTTRTQVMRELQAIAAEVRQLRLPSCPDAAAAGPPPALSR